MSPFKFFFLFFIIVFSSKCQDESALLELIKSYIQNHVSNDVLINLIEIIRFKNKHNFPDNYNTNKKAFANHKNAITRTHGYIEDQSNYKDMQYGIRPLSTSGCGLIAIYNVLYHITQDSNIDFPSIIKSLEDDGIILRGYFGTSMVAVDDYLRKRGYNTRSSSQKKDFDKIGQESEACVLTVYNSVDDIFQGMHFMAITKKNGKYYVHNNGGYNIAYTSITDALGKINGGKAKEIYLTGVSK